MKRHLLAFILPLILMALPAMGAVTTSTSFTATGGGTQYAVNPATSPTINYSVTGTFVGTVALQYSTSPTVYWSPVLNSSGTAITATTTASGTVSVASLFNVPTGSPVFYRWYCTAYTSGTIVAAFTTTDVFTRTITVNGYSKAGTTAGYVVGAANNLGTLATLPASQTGSTLVAWIPGLRPGDQIVGYQVVGNVTSAGATVNLDADLRSLTSAAAAPTDASLGTTITTVSVTSNTALNASTGLGGATLATAHTVLPGESFYALITGTTAAATTHALQAVQVTYVPGP